MCDKVTVDNVVYDASVEIKSENISNYELKEPIDVADITNSSECTIKCEVEDTKIVFSIKEEFRYSDETCMESGHNPLQLKNESNFVPILSPLFKEIRLDQELYEQRDWTEKLTPKEELSIHINSPDCKETFIIEENLDDHCKTIIADNCDQSYALKQSLNYHQISQHLKLKPYDCADCEKKYNTKQSLNKHRTSQHLKLKPYQCLDCKQNFASKFSLEYHQMSQHLKLYPYKCPDCDRRYILKSRLRCHQNLQHLKLKQHQCSNCNQSFMTKQHLTYHQIAHHLNPKSYQCTDCNKTYNSKQSLYTHQTSQHLKLKGYYCAECDQRYNSKQSMNRHRMFQHP